MFRRRKKNLDQNKIKKGKIIQISLSLMSSLEIVLILISIKLYLEGELGYFIAFWIVIGIIKSIWLLKIFNESGGKWRVVQILDFFNLGIINLFFDHKFFKGQIQFKIFFSYALAILQFIYFFGVKIYAKHELSDLVVYGFYFFFIAYLLTPAIFSVFINVESKQYSASLIRSYCYHCSYYLMIGQLTMVYDKDNTNMGYYCLLVLGLSGLLKLVLLIKYRKFYSYKSVSVIFLYFVYMIDIQLFQDLTHTYLIISNRVCFVADLVKQSFLFILVLSYNNFSELLKFGDTNNREKLIGGINTVILLVTVSCYLLVCIWQFTFEFLTRKFMLIYEPRDLLKAIKVFQKSNPSIKQYIIFNFCKQKIDCKVISPDIYRQLQGPGEQQRECICFYFYKQIGKRSNCDQYYNLIVQNDFMCECNLFNRLLEEEEFICKTVNSKIYSISKRESSNIARQRLLKGYIFNKITEEIINVRLYDEEWQNIYLKLQSHTLSVMVYLKLISNQMLFNPREIIFDLYHSAN